VRRDVRCVRSREATSRADVALAGALLTLHRFREAKRAVADAQRWYPQNPAWRPKPPDSISNSATSTVRAASCGHGFRSGVRNRPGQGG